MYHSWDTSRCRAAAIDGREERRHLHRAHPLGFNYWGPHQRYHVENFREALECRGEWFLDRDWHALLPALAGEDRTRRKSCAPAGPDGSSVSRGSRTRALVEHVTQGSHSFAMASTSCRISVTRRQPRVTIPAAFMATALAT